MPKYKVLADGHITVNLDKKGDITGKTRHKKGDTVVMTESAAERLVNTGGLVLASEATDDAGEAQGSTEPEATPEGQDGAEDGQDDATVDYTDEDEYKYSDLQDLAKERGLSAGGSRDDLVERLVEFDKAQSA